MLHGGLFTDSDLADLIAIRERTTDRLVKGGGVVDTNARAAMTHPAVVRAIETVAGPDCTVGWCMFVDTPFALAIHADTGSADHFHDVMMIVPLDSVPNPPPGTVFFAQHWFGRSANFVKGTPDFPGKINMTVDDYRDVVGLTDEPFPEDFYRENLWHLKPQWTEGLSVDSFLPWTWGGCISFPRSQIHASASIEKGTWKRSLIIRAVPPL